MSSYRIPSIVPYQPRVFVPIAAPATGNRRRRVLIGGMSDMQYFKQSTAATIIVGPILDSTGAEYTGAVIGDISLSKNGGTLTALASAATLTHIANGQYTLVFTTGNLDTIGRADVSCNKSTYQMPPRELQVLQATVYDALITNAAGGANGFVLSKASNIVDANVISIGPTGANTAQTARDVGLSVLVGDKTGFSLSSTQTFSVTGNITGNLSGSVGSLTTNNDKTGYALTSAYDPAKTASQAGDAMALTSGERTTLTAAIWAALTSGLTTSGSIGKRLVDFVTSLVYSAPPTAAQNATAVWTDTTAGDFTTATSPGKIIFTQLGGAFTTTSSSVFTVGALANAPSGGGTAPTAAQNAAAVWQDLTSSGDFLVSGSIGAFVIGLSPSGGSGAWAVTITVDDGASALQGANVRMTKGATTVILQTDASGVTLPFSLDTGTWTVNVSLAGYSFTQTTLAVSSNTTHTYSMTAVTITPSPAGETTGYLVVYSVSGAVAAGVVVSCTNSNTAASPTGVGMTLGTRTATSDVNGLVQFTGLILGETYTFSIGTGTKKQQLIPTTAGTTYELPGFKGTVVA